MSVARLLNEHCLLFHRFCAFNIHSIVFSFTPSYVQIDWNMYTDMWQWDFFEFDAIGNKENALKQKRICNNNKRITDTILTLPIEFLSNYSRYIFAYMIFYCALEHIWSKQNLYPPSRLHNRKNAIKKNFVPPKNSR